MFPDKLKSTSATSFGLTRILVWCVFLDLPDWKVVRDHLSKEGRIRKEEVLKLYDPVFFRMWDLYLIASEISFRYGKLANFQIQLTRRQAEGPRNRNYIAEAEARLQANEPLL